VGWACSANGGDEKCAEIIGRKAKGKETTGDQDVGGWITLRLIMYRYDGLVWNGLVWRIGTSEELL
jgi:hypothetical protein